MRPDLEAIRASLWSPSTTASTFAEDVAALLAYVEEMEERCRAYQMMSHEIARALDTWKQEEVPDETRP